MADEALCGRTNFVMLIVLMGSVTSVNGDRPRIPMACVVVLISLG